MSDQRAHEIVIVRHRDNGDHDGHHGGVWKIAYADFMTAMMAFFLVMWLINAANEQTKKAVASYFSPIKLTDVTTNPRGVQDLQFGAKHLDKLEEMIEHKDVKGSAARGSSKVPENKDAVIRDPLAVPASAEEPTNGHQGSLAKTSLHSRAEYAQGDELLIEAPLPEHNGATRLHEDKAKPIGKSSSVTEEAKSARLSDEKPAPLVKNNETVSTDHKLNDVQQTAESSVLTAATKSQIETALKGIAVNKQPAIVVEATADGVLISLTDKLDFNMFKIGSPEPQPYLLDALNAIGRVLAGRSEKLVIRGHTDSRPFRSVGYDNWRLSWERAHVVLAVLEESGVVPQRVERIEGHADRQPRRLQDPLAAQNRRIEILMIKDSR